jgi:hypothetical protein
MKNAARIVAFLSFASLSATSAIARAQDADATAVDAAADSSAADATADASAVATSTGNCPTDPIPAGHEVRSEFVVQPARPIIGDRVIITYRVYHHSSDGVEFDPDPVAYSQPDAELEYAREQPDRDRRVHAAPGGLVFGEVQVAVQGFKAGDIVIAPQLARLRAAGDVIRVCTPEVRFRIHDPFGNVTHPAPRDVTMPEAVSEDAYRWRWFALALDLIFAVILATLAINSYLARRPKKVAPPPPPRPAWIVAVEALDAIARSDLLSRGATKEYYDAISDVVRRYLGGTRGFDALEMTTEEVLRHMRKSPLHGVAPAEIEHLLRECDLVKFARYVPSHEESDKILESAYAIVRRSSPAGTAAPTGPTGPSGPSTTTGGDTAGRRA